MKNLLRVLVGLTIFPGIFACLMSPMMLDAPGSENNPIALIMIASVWTYPPLAAIGVIMSFRSLRWLALPLFSFALFFGAAILLDAKCGGKFSCH